MNKFCVYCGNRLHPGARFCGKCGAGVAGAGDPAAQPEPQIQAQPQPAVLPVSEETAVPPAEPVSVPGKDGIPVKGERKKGTGLLSAGLAVLLVIQTAVVVLYGWPGFLLQEKWDRTSIENAVAELPGMTMDFSDSTYGGQVLEHTTTASADIDEGALSEGYGFTFDSTFEGAVQVSAPWPEDLTLAGNEALYLDIGVPLKDWDGEEMLAYHPVDASREGERITARITPSDYTEMASAVRLSGGGNVEPLFPGRLRFNAQFKVKEIHGSGTERFRLVMDRSRLMATTLEEGMIQELLSRMEQVYSHFEELGFDMSRRTRWPMDIHVTTIRSSGAQSLTYGQYVSSWLGINHGYMNLSRLLFTNYNAGETTSIFAHELFHFIQECYVSSQYYRLDWLDEATSVFFENYFGGISDHSSRQYELYQGIFPDTDNARDGYVRGALISYWAFRYGWMDGTDPLSGKHTMSGLIDLYSTGGYIKESRWTDWIVDRTEDPGEYALDFFTKMVLNAPEVWAELAYAPHTLHQVILGNEDKSIQNFTSALTVSAGEVTGPQGQTAQVSVPGYGARVVALNIPDKELDRLSQSGALSVSSVGGDPLVLIRSRGKAVETQAGISISSPGLVQSLKDSHRYLVLLVNTEEEEKVLSFTLQMEGEKSDPSDGPDYSGTYRGTYTSADGDTVYQVKTVITRATDSEDGSGPLYTIFCMDEEMEDVIYFNEIAFDISRGGTGTFDIRFSSGAGSVTIELKEWDDTIGATITGVKQ